MVWVAAAICLMVGLNGDDVLSKLNLICAGALLAVGVFNVGIGIVHRRVVG